MNTTVHLYHIDKNYKVIREFHGYKAAAQYFHCAFHTITDRVRHWRRYWRNGTLTILKAENYKELILHEICVIRREIQQKKKRLGELKNEYSKHRE
jgi:hypothetical protein